jgi:hypothetical protein
MAAKKDEATVEAAELTPEVKEELFTAPIEVIPTGEAPAHQMHGHYNQNTGEFLV